MRTVSATDSVRLYHVGDAEGGAATTLLYGSLSDALAMAADQAEDIQEGLFLQTSSDVVAYLDFVEE